MQLTQQLIQKEKVANLGELTAGIVHAIQNPCTSSRNFSEVSTELIAKLREAPAAGDAPEAAALANVLTQNLATISRHGQRAADIVRGTLKHSRQRGGEHLPLDLNALCEEYLRRAYHGLRAKDKAFGVELHTDLIPALPLVAGVGADLGRVLLNLFTNAFYAVRQRQWQAPAGYVPTLGVRTACTGQQVLLVVSDNGIGMSGAVQTKVFQPFFTTKPAGVGTGLGLSLSYDIVTRGHGGTLRVESQEGAGAAFSLALPLAPL